MVASIDTALPCASGTGRQPRRLEFPGCLEVRLTRTEVERYEGHIELWDARTGLAMVSEPPYALAHEFPAQRLTKLATLIAVARGSPIEMFGATDLLQLAGDGEWRRIMQPDQIVYLNPGEHTPPGNQIKVGEDRLPDVVLEVDNTTDVRRGKLYLYESWGFPEVWVEVPDKPARSRPKSLRPGLTIHVLERGRFVETSISRAFPGWTAGEIHRAMNETSLSEETVAALRRVGRRLGAAEGTGPGDDPFLDAELRESRAAVLHKALQQVFAARGISVSWTSRTNWPMELECTPVELLMQAALECRNEDDFLKQLRAG
ncbi:MAG: hypothetical protein F4089_09875 [Gammaproteobacteria bacterium]|nr:hypothetical protein [Gammaproteobacteria bacterium]